jgi:hypothetical protein
MSFYSFPHIHFSLAAQQPLTPVLARAPTPAQALTPSSPPRPVQRDGSGGATARTLLDDDSSMREEGEISDNEDPPFRLPLKPIPPPISATAAGRQAGSQWFCSFSFVWHRVTITVRKNHGCLSARYFICICYDTWYAARHGSTFYCPKTIGDLQV